MSVSGTASDRAAPAKRWPSRVAWILWGLTVLGVAASVVLFALNGVADLPSYFGSRAFDPILMIGVLAFATVGAVVLTRRPGHRIGWILLLSGLAGVLLVLGSEYALAGVYVRPGRVPGALVMAWVENWVWVPWLFLSAVYLPLLFPSGGLLSPRWRPVLYAAPAGIALSVLGLAFVPRTLDPPFANVRNPFRAPHALGTAIEAGSVVGWLLLVSSVVAAVVSSILRYRRSGSQERRQIKWFAYGAVLLGLSFIVGSLAYETAEGSATLVSTIPAVLGGVGLLAVPAGIGIAILRHGLYDIDLVINRTVVFGVLATFITAVYVAVVVGIGAAIGQTGGPNLGLSILATAVVAVAFQPIRRRAQRVANRLVYGSRLSPYEVLSQLSHHLSGTFAGEEVLPRMARIIAEGTGAERAMVWLRVGPELVPAAAWPSGAPPAPVPLRDGEVHVLPDADRAVAVRHRGELLGAVSIAKPAGEGVTPGEDQLLADLASQAGLVLRNFHLTSELEARLEEISGQARELQASRQRIVEAQDAERRRLERNIHDGAQQHLVALAVRLRLARSLALKDPDRARVMLLELQTQAGEALETLRDLARGIYPLVLVEQGLEAALRGAAGRAGVPVVVEAGGGTVGRYGADVEAAVYFCCLEALQNAAKHAGASRVVVNLSGGPDHLRFSVTDDGAGFDVSAASRGTGIQNMVDRVEALGGVLEVRSEPGVGTTVAGRIPARAVEPVA